MWYPVSYILIADSQFHTVYAGHSTALLDVLVMMLYFHDDFLDNINVMVPPYYSHII